MASKTNKVYQHFNHVEHYLHQSFDIKIRAEMVKELIGIPENADILDFGCGDGSISLQFQSKSNLVTLVDISENMLQRARLNIRSEHIDRIELLQADANSFSPGKKYDLILGLGLLAHVDSVAETIEKMSLLLKKNGHCLLQITDHDQTYTKILSIYNKILDKITGQFGYKRNKLFMSRLIGICKDYGLKYDNSKQYSLMVPGFTFLLPDKLLYFYHLQVKNNSFLSSMGTDFIISFKKT